jgi:probable rRNA maturation factor
MALTVSIQGQSRFDGLPARSTLVRWLQAALERDAELTLRFVGAAEARRLNRTFRGKDYATNVLTFDYQHAPVVRADIVLCVPVVRREAREQRKGFRDHLAHLVVHGVLHAQGHEHDRAADARTMEAREVRVLAGLGIDDPYRDGGVAGGRAGRSALGL